MRAETSRKGGLQSVWRDLVPADARVKVSSEKGPNNVDTPDFPGLNVNTETSIDDPNWSHNDFDGCKPQGFDPMAASTPMASTPAGSSMVAPAAGSMVGGQAAIGGGVQGMSGGGAERGGGTGGEWGHDAVGT